MSGTNSQFKKGQQMRVIWFFLIHNIIHKYLGELVALILIFLTIVFTCT